MSQPIPLKSIRINTDKYKFNHGKYPRGFGLWWFKVGAEIVDHWGYYSDACKMARVVAQRQGIYEIEVCS